MPITTEQKQFIDKTSDMFERLIAERKIKAKAETNEIKRCGLQGEVLGLQDASIEFLKLTLQFFQ